MSELKKFIMLWKSPLLLLAIVIALLCVPALLLWGINLIIDIAFFVLIVCILVTVIKFFIDIKKDNR